MPRPPKDRTTGITTTDLDEMRRIWDSNGWGRATHRFKWSVADDRWELWHQPSNSLKAYCNAQGQWVEA